MSEWRITLPQSGSQLLTANQRLHHLDVYQRRKQIISSVIWLCRARKIPPMRRAHITYELTVPDRKRRDPENWAPSVKAALDGIVKAGVLPDDSWQYVDGPHPLVILMPRHKLSLSLVIREVPGDDAGVDKDS